MRLSIFALVLAAGLGLGVLGCGQESPMSPVTPSTALAPEGKPTGGGSTRSYDASYMKAAIDREEFIRQLALLALSKQLDHSDLATFSQNAASTAGQSIALLQGYLGSWYNVQHPAALSGSAQRTLNSLAALEGAAFEKAYLNQMVSQDQLRVREGQRCYSRATQTMLIYFGFNDQLTATQEIAQLKSWLCQWFSAC
jgi:uncharacterized protein (DUF305 family)